MQSSVDVAVEILKDLEEFNRSGSKEGFRKQLRKEFVRRSGAVSLDEAGYGFGLSGPFPGDDPTIAETRCRIAQAEKTCRLCMNSIPIRARAPVVWCLPLNRKPAV